MVKHIFVVVLKFIYLVSINQNSFNSDKIAKPILVILSLNSWIVWFTDGSKIFCLILKVLKACNFQRSWACYKICIKFVIKLSLIQLAKR